MKEKKTAEIKVVVTAETKKKLKVKAEELGLSITGLIEKIAHEPLVFIDNNAKNIFSLFANGSFPQSFPRKS